ncbi:MAG: DUF374 domain-containing protein [Gemmatimonadota bacterium]|nr:DUF374 domain-containing protein [Gemmatimonadota bacterium]MDH4351547.1 DUF374 domain-containing protein [Gemmatimonadota bacterium]MDH5196744.1 DUF374 domain-containing protein [Gemmatimonadota bacterium]
MTPLADRVLQVAFRCLAATWRFEIRGGHHHARVAGGPFLFALWHHTLLPLLWWHRHRGITLLVSQHRDGALAASAAARLGYDLARGSSTRDGAKAYRHVLRALAAGGAVAVTPDGPTGPPGMVKPGVIRAALRARVPVLPVSARVDRAWHLRSWDRLVIPRPFARIVIGYGEPLRPAPGEEATACAALGGALDGLARPPRSEAA